MTTDVRIGTEFAGYRVESVLGRGGMGVVYLAEDARLGRKVALKLLPPELARDGRFRERFIRESQMAAHLEHPNILPVYEAGESDGQLFIAMRYVRGADLGSVLQAEGPLPAERAVSIVTDVAAALDEAHGEGLIHRDVKPANVLLAPARGPGSPERAYLTDFGVTRRTSSRSGLTQTGQFMGTVDYAAPEQIQGKDVDGRADVYSLGCVLYQCLTGQPPFVRDSDVATMYAHLKERPPKPTAKRPELPPSVDEVVAMALAKAPTDRYQTAGDLAAAARTATGGTLVAPRLRRPKARTLWAAGVVLTLVAAGAIAFIVARQDGPVHRTAGPPTTAPGTPQGLVRVDPASAEVLGSVPVITQGDPGVAFGEGFVWTLTPQGVRKINMEGIELGEPIGVGSARSFAGGPTAVAAGEGALWVINTPANQTGPQDQYHSRLFRVDPRTNGVREFILPGMAPGGAFATLPLAVGEGWVWTVDRTPSSLVRIDPRDPVRRSRFPLPSTGDGIAVGLGSVWLRHNTGIESSLLRVNPQTGRVIDEIPLPGSADGLAVGGGNVWVADSSNDELIRIDPVTVSIAAHFHVGPDPRALVIDGEGNPWVVLAGQGAFGTLAKVQAAAGEVVETLPLSGLRFGEVRANTQALVFGFDSIWVE